MQKAKANKAINDTKTLLHVQTFRYRGLGFSEVVMIGGIPHITRKAIGEFLGYSHASAGCGLLVRRHAHIIAKEKQAYIARGNTNSLAYLYGPDAFFAILLATEMNRFADKKADIEAFMAEFSTHQVEFKSAEKSKLPSKFVSLDEKNNLIKSGRALSGILGVSMPKVYRLIRMPEFNFPKPAKSVCHGSVIINYYTRDDIEAFMRRVDVKKPINGERREAQSISAIAKDNKIDKQLYFNFFGVKRENTERYGIACQIGDHDNGLIQGGSQ